jgi:hypothetical protein
MKTNSGCILQTAATLLLALLHGFPYPLRGQRSSVWRRWCCFQVYMKVEVQAMHHVVDDVLQADTAGVYIGVMSK